MYEFLSYVTHVIVGLLMFAALLGPTIGLSMRQLAILRAEREADEFDIWADEQRAAAVVHHI